MAGGLLALALPALSACGFNYPTDRPNEIIHGGTDLGDGLRVNAARIVSAGPDQGVFIATLTLNPTVNAATKTGQNPSMTGLRVGEDGDRTVTAQGQVDVEIPDSGAVNLADPSVGGIPVTGDFRPGDIVEMEISFDDGDSVSLNVPVVTQCGEYAEVVAAGKSRPAEVPSGTTLENEYACEFPGAPASGEGASAGGH